MSNIKIDLSFLKNLIEDIRKDKEVIYAELRFSNIETENIFLKNLNIEQIKNNIHKSFGVRILINGAWGFAGTNIINKDSIYNSIQKAKEIAKANSFIFKRKINFKNLPSIEDTYKSPYKIDPFKLDIKDKINLLFSLNEKALKYNDIILITSNLNFIKEERLFANTEDRYIKQNFIKSGAGYSVFASDGKQIQRRSYPAQFGGDFAQAGFEFIQDLKLIENLEQKVKEAQELLKAPDCPFRKMDLILIDDQLALQVHESTGHPSELDRVLGTEESFAGSSFLTTDKLGKLKYGSEVVNIFVDANIKGALGSRKYDSEGVRTKKEYIIKDGILTGYLTSRDTASVINRESNGSAVAQSAMDYPIIRMTNVNLQPGNTPLQDIIEDTKDGILLKTNKSWSIDDKRLNFQFGTELGYLIKKGKITGICKNPIYSGITPEFWNSCDVVADKKTWHVWGIPNCGKGEPMQTAQVAHGVSGARFKNVQLGVRK